MPRTHLKSDHQCVIVRYNLPVTMRDGTRLSTDVYRPNDEQQHPVVLTRTCYNKTKTGDFAGRGRYWASRGYVFVVQDVRGRGDSAGGPFYPLIHEAEDGRDALTWAGTQSWSNGQVALVGGSYSAWTQLYPATLNPKHLAALAPISAPPDPDQNFPVSRGVLMPAGLAWLATLEGQTLQEVSAVDVRLATETLPMVEWDSRIGRTLPAWKDWVAHISDRDYWKAQAYQEKLAAAQSVPTLHISGWYDDVLVGTTENFIALTRTGRPSAHQAQQRLVIGPWLHNGMGSRKVGAIDFGPEAEVDLLALQQRWFDHWLKGEDNGVAAECAVKVFVMGRNTWIESASWPLAGTKYVAYYLHSGGRANSRLGDGTLSTVPPHSEPADHFSHDPENPVPYMSTDDWTQVGGPDDFSTVELREDVLVYTGPVLQEPLLICGPLKVRLFAASSALDTDWTAKVLDVHPDGFCQRLNDGIVRARFRRGTEREVLLTPGVVEEYDIDCWSTCIELAPGHRLRLEIASSAFGKTDVNPNTGGPIGRDTGTVIASQRVMHDQHYPSCLLLPVLSRVT